MKKKTKFNLYYSINKEKLPQEIHKLFKKLDYDQETDDFFHTVENFTIFESFKVVFCKPLLTCFFNTTTTNSILETGKMFVFSTSHISQLLSNSKKDTLLDIGSGDGSVTSKYSHFFNETTCVEVSSGMIYRLKQKGYNVIESLDLVKNSTFDVITCLNVLDRCEKPMTLLDQINELMHSDSVLLMTIVLPLYQYVENGNVKEKMIENGLNFHDSLIQMYKLLKDMFEIISISRIPYLSQGDISQDYYILDSAVFLLNKK